MQNRCHQIFTNFVNFRKHLESNHKQKNSILETSNTTENMTAENMLDVQETTDTELDISHTLEESFDLGNGSTRQDISKVLYNLKLKSLELTLSLYDANAMPRNQVVKIQNSFASMLKSISHSLERLLDKTYVSKMFARRKLLLI